MQAIKFQPNFNELHKYHVSHMTVYTDIKLLRFYFVLIFMFSLAYVILLTLYYAINYYTIEGCFTFILRKILSHLYIFPFNKTCLIKYYFFNHQYSFKRVDCNFQRFEE